MDRIGQKIRKLEVGIARDFLKIGRLLREVRDGGWSGAEDTFADWVDVNCGFNYRKGQDLIKIVDAQDSLDIPDSKLVHVGWSKLARVATSLDHGWAQTLAWAAATTYNEVNERVANCPDGERLESSTRSDPNSGDAAKRVLTFTREQRATFDETVDLAREKFQTTNRETALVRLLELVKPLL